MKNHKPTGFTTRPRRQGVLQTARTSFVPSFFFVAMMLLADSLSSCCAFAFAFSTQDYASVGKEIQQLHGLDTSSRSTIAAAAALEVAAKFWLPTDPDLPPHLRQQAIHHEKRQRWASQLLERLATITLSTATTSSTTSMLDNNNDISTNGLDESTTPLLWHDERLTRLVLAAALPFAVETEECETGLPSNNNDRLAKEGRWLEISLVSLYTILAATAENTNKLFFEVHDDNEEAKRQNQLLLLRGIRHLINRSTALAQQYPLNQACQVLWAIQGLKSRIPELLVQESDNSDNNHHYDTNFSRLQERVEALPFSIIPQGLDWSQCVGVDQNDNQDHNHHALASSPSTSSLINSLLDAIPFAKDVLVTRQGTSVQERRGTAWIAKPDVGALAYSGKLMPPQPLPPIVANVMNHVEERLELPSDFFDCALCNHYADRGSACKFHTDPEHGSHWDRTTVVVAAGSSRKFAFKPIAEMTSWNEWDNVVDNNNNEAAVIPLFAGDLVVMTQTCNDDFYHAVHAGDSDDPRISLVLKRALERNSGQKGHGLHGQGRRRKRNRSNQQTNNHAPSSSRGSSGIVSKDNTGTGNGSSSNGPPGRRRRRAAPKEVIITSNKNKKNREKRVSRQ